MNYWRLIFYILVVFIGQISLLPLFSIHYALPNLIFLFMVAYLIIGQDIISLWWLAVGGLLTELISPLPFGVFSLLLLVIFLAFRYIIRPFIHEPSPLIAAAIFCLTSLIFNGLIFLILRLPPFFTLPLIAVLETIIGVAIYSLILRWHNHRIPLKVK